MDFDRFDRQAQSLLDRVSTLRDASRGEPTGAASQSPDVLAWVAEAADRLAAARVFLRDARGMIDLARFTAEEHSRRYKELFDRAPAAYLVTGPTGLVVACNQAAADMFGEKAEKIVGRAIQPRLADGGGCLDEPLARLRRGDALPAFAIPIRDGGPRVIDAVAKVETRLDGDGEPVEFLWILLRPESAPALPEPPGVLSPTLAAPIVEFELDGEDGLGEGAAGGDGSGAGEGRRRPDSWSRLAAVQEADRDSRHARGPRLALRRVLAGLVAASRAESVVMRIDDAGCKPLEFVAWAAGDLTESSPAGGSRLIGGDSSPLRTRRLALRSRSGEVLGSIDFHFGTHGHPPVGGRRLIKQLARRASDMLEIEQLRRRLADSQARGRRALAVLAHEMRTPLSVVLNSAYLLAQAGVGDPEVEDVAARLTRQARFMSRLVDDLLDQIRSADSSLRLTFEEVDLESAMRSAAEAIGPMAEAKGQRLVISPPQPGIRIEADPHRLEQMLTNLLVNAIRFTGTGGRISMSARHEAGEVVLSVQDTGVGFEPASADRIFEPFVHADDGYPMHEGLGLGLSLVRALAEGHGGSIGCTSSGRNRGSEFVLRLPTRRTAENL